MVGGSATGNIDSPGDRDWFAVELEAGKTYRFDLKGWSTGGGTWMTRICAGSTTRTATGSTARYE